MFKQIDIRDAQQMMSNLLYCALALTAFAGNSLLCRWALADGLIEPADFTVIRLGSGAFSLYVLTLISLPAQTPFSVLAHGSFRGALALFIYAALFSFAYVSLDTATGALILFGAVQFTLIVLYLSGGKRLSNTEWLGVVLAISGFVVLLLPSATTPSVTGFLLMLIAGGAWGAYTWFGAKSQNPLADTAANFIYTLPFCLVMYIVSGKPQQLDNHGVWLAVVSGVLTSGIGYAVWYRVVPHLSTLQASISQLTVPFLAAVAGMVILGEHLALQFWSASVLVLLGILTLNLSEQPD
ncbi:DMT family transporter [Planctobacterium marinum]|uniref:EamA domain-containing protein n=1 Tax=Planctobacterium marinum TaxID=1631968 RepID=A0AA48KVS9_9ALTE|nr:hypothetical protein MACH26_33560 [Planctobacterium marinum]